MEKGREQGRGGPGILAQQQLITLWDPKSNGAEAYRSMRSALLLSSIDNPPRVIVITSSFPGEGKTTTALNLAIVLAQRGERVLLVDADLRRGSLYRVFGIPNQSFGLSTVLTQPEIASGPAGSAAGIADSARSADRSAAAEPGRNAFLQSHGGADAAVDTAVRQDRD